MERINSEIVFGDEKVKNAFDKLDSIKEQDFRKQLVKAFQNLKEDIYCGIQIPKKLIPKEYIKRFGVLTNL